MSEEFTAPTFNNNYVNSALLTNITGSSIFLQVQETNADEDVVPLVVQLAADESILYNSLVISATNAGSLPPTAYNKDIVDSYISEGVLSLSTVLPTPPNSYVLGLPNSTHSLSVSNGNVVKKVSVKAPDLLEIFYSTTVNKLTILVYRGISGFYFSVDSGITIIPIPTTGMSYPEEVTSISIQNVKSVSNPGNITIWAGTLREGLLAYTLGDSSWSVQVDKEHDVAGVYLFRHSKYTSIVNSDLTTTYYYVPLSYAPVYILGILNNPQESGLPIAVYVKPYILDSTAGNTYTQYLKTYYKYLTPDYISYTQDITYGIWRTSKQITQSIDAGYSWTVFTNPLINELFDVLKSIPYNTNAGKDQTSQQLTAISTFNPNTNRFSVEFLKLSCSVELRSPITSTTFAITNRELTVAKDDTIGNTILIEPQDFSGLSCFNTDIFITEKEKIWRYTNNVWSAWLISYDTTPALNLRITPSYEFATIGSTSYVSGLRGFGILQNKIKNEYVGVVNTDMGYFLFTLIPTTKDYMTVHPVIPFSNKKSLFGTSVRDLQIIPESNSVISCGLSDEPIVKYNLSNTTFGAPVRYYTYSPQMLSTFSANVQYTTTQIFYKNYKLGSDTLPYLINMYNYTDSSSLNSDQLYLNYRNTADVGVLKEVTSAIHYIDTTHTFAWLIFPRAIGYMSFMIKYNRLKLLLQTSQKISLLNTTLSSNQEMPFVPDAAYQIIS